jgi:hypothetical protein
MKTSSSRVVERSVLWAEHLPLACHLSCNDAPPILALVAVLWLS